MKHSKGQLKIMATTVLNAQKSNDQRFAELVVTLSQITGLDPQTVIHKIERLAA